MKNINYTFFFTILMSMIVHHIYAHNISVKNSDGKTIYYNFNSDGSSVSVTYLGTSYDYSSNEYSGEIVIPETITYSDKTYSVTSIGSSAFDGCSGLTSVTIPNSVTSIGDYAFDGCRRLTSVIIGNSVTSIGSSAFDGCSNLTSVTIPNSVTSIGSDAFCGTAWYDNQPEGLVYAGNVAYKYKGTMPANTSITLKEGTVGIASSAFNGCSGLTSVTIPNSVTSIGSSAFYKCSGLTSVIIPNSVTSISSFAFGECSGLTSVTIPNSVTSIGSSAFYDTKIKSLTIGSGIQTIAYDAFSYNPFTNGEAPVKVVWLPNTPPSGYENVKGTVNYVANNLYTKLSNATVYPFLNSMFEVDGIKYVPVSPSERTCDAIDCMYDTSAENINIGETVSYKGVSLNVKQ